MLTQTSKRWVYTVVQQSELPRPFHLASWSSVKNLPIWKVSLPLVQSLFHKVGYSTRIGNRQGCSECNNARLAHKPYK